MKKNKRTLKKSILIGGGIGLIPSIFVLYIWDHIYIIYSSSIIALIYWILAIPYFIGAFIVAYILRCFDDIPFCNTMYKVMGTLIWILIGTGIAYLIFKRKMKR